MRVRVDHSDITWLAVDQAEIVIGARRQMPGIVRSNVRKGMRAEKTIAKAAAGPHGKSYYKRITSRMSKGFAGATTSVYQGEWGPHDGGTPVGAGWRHGVNTDAARSADLIAPGFRKDVSDMIGSLFATRNRTGR
jgi:hypothetical protein